MERIERIHHMVLGSLIADSHALGVHWIYDTGVIEERKELLEQLSPPYDPRFHPSRKAGEHTHYGDQVLQLLSSLARHGGWYGKRFFSEWVAAMRAYDGYLDHATRETLAAFERGESKPTEIESRSSPGKNLDSGSGSFGAASLDLGGAARLAPLLLLYRGNREALAAAAGEQTVLTHNHRLTRLTAELLASAAAGVADGLSPREAVIVLGKEIRSGHPLAEHIRKAIASAGDDTTAAVRDFGQGCGLSGALPAALHLVVKYDDNYRQAMIANALAGGDSAARGLAAGMLIGGSDSPHARIPDTWLSAYRFLETAEERMGVLLHDG